MALSSVDAVTDCCMPFRAGCAVAAGGAGFVSGRRFLAQLYRFIGSVTIIIVGIWTVLGSVGVTECVEKCPAQ